MQNKRFGFTLLELLISISILAIIMAIGIPAYRAAESRQILKNAAQMLAMDLKAQRQRANQMNYTACGITVSGTYNGVNCSSGYCKFDKETTTNVNKSGINFQRLFGRNITLTISCTSGTCSNSEIRYEPAAGGGTLSMATVTLDLGVNRITVTVGAGGEVTVGNIQFI